MGAAFCAPPTAFGALLFVMLYAFPGGVYAGACAQSAAERLSRAASCGRTSGRCLRSAAPPFSNLPAPEAPTWTAPPILAAMTTRARRWRAGRLWRPDLQLVEVNGARRPSLDATLAF